MFHLRSEKKLQNATEISQIIIVAEISIERNPKTSHSIYKHTFCFARGLCKNLADFRRYRCHIAVRLSVLEYCPNCCHYTVPCTAPTAVIIPCLVLPQLLSLYRALYCPNCCHYKYTVPCTAPTAVIIPCLVLPQLLSLQVYRALYCPNCCHYKYTVPCTAPTAAIIPCIVLLQLLSLYRALYCPNSCHYTVPFTQMFHHKTLLNPSVSTEIV